VTTDAWRGVAAEDTDQLTAGVSALLRRRARRLLTDLLRPHKRLVAGTLVLVVTENLAALTGPWLVGIGIDQGIPPLIHGGDLVPPSPSRRSPPAPSSGRSAGWARTSCSSCASGCSRTSSGCRSPFTSTTPPAA
jgi:hypothetical protein